MTNKFERSLGPYCEIVTMRSKQLDRAQWPVVWLRELIVFQMTLNFIEPLSVSDSYDDSLLLSDADDLNSQALANSDEQDDDDF